MNAIKYTATFCPLCGTDHDTLPGESAICEGCNAEIEAAERADEDAAKLSFIAKYGSRAFRNCERADFRDAGGVCMSF